MEIPFTVIDWSTIVESENPGETGKSIQKVLEYPGLRIRKVEYTPGYHADHWCQKGHIVHCLEGEITSMLEDGKCFQLTRGMTYIVSDHLSSHRSNTKHGAKLLIIDGDFLK